MHPARALPALALALSLVPGPAAAWSASYTTKAPVDEWNPSLGTATARPMIAAGIMGALGCGAPAINLADETKLLARCQQASPANTTWPEQCSPAGLAIALQDRYAQPWLTGAQTSQDAAIADMLAAAINYKAPSIVPLAGQPDRWATLVRFDVSLVGLSPIVTKLWFYSAAHDTASGVQDDGLRIVSGTTFRNVHYKRLTGLAATDPFHDKYAYAHDPPADAATVARVAVDPARGAPLLGDDERLTDDLAAALVFHALDLEGLLDDPALAELRDRGVADTAIPIDDVLADGAAWSRVEVTIVDPATGEPLARVDLAADDGAFEQLHLLPRRAPAKFSRRP